MQTQGVAYFSGSNGITGTVIFQDVKSDCCVKAKFTALPPGKHGFHIHRAGDLRGEGCAGACDHYHKGPPCDHGGPPSSSKAPRHTGDLGNISGTPFTKSYTLKGVCVADLLGRAVIVHEDEDDLGKGTEEDSKTTGHAGKRIGCALIGRIPASSCTKKTRKAKKV